jgi:uncharacterized membrane protein HdeD (DUF308 family)
VRSAGSLDRTSRLQATGLGPLVKNWRLLAARGVLAILLGLSLMLWRVPRFQAVIVPFAIYAFIDGVLAITSALRVAGSRIEGWPIVLEGIVSVVAGVLVLVAPALYRVVPMLVAWGVLTGMFEIAAAVRLPRERAAHRLVAAGGLSSIFLALLILGLSRANSDRVVYMLAGYAIVFGLVILLAALRLRPSRDVTRDIDARRGQRD